MTNAELAEHLNAEAGLTGDQAVSLNVIRQWIAWDVLPKSAAKGQRVGQAPTWSRSGVGMRRALRLAELRRLGVKRQTAVIVQAYIEWGHSDFERVRSALQHELRKWSAQLARHRTTYVGDADYRSLSAVKKRAIRTQLGPIDSRFSGTRFQQSDELYSALAELAVFGEPGAASIPPLITSAFDKMLPGFGQFFKSSSIDEIANALAGALGSPDEIANSGQSEIERATEREFRIARVALHKIQKMQAGPKEIENIFGHAGPVGELSMMLAALSPQISVGPWTVVYFAHCLLSVLRGANCPEIELNDENLAKFSELSQLKFDMLKR